MDKTLTSDASSIVDLKAELYRKQEAAKLAKLNSDFKPFKRIPFKCKEQVCRSKQKPAVELSDSTYSEEERALQKSRLTLSAKAKLYDEIVSEGLDISECSNDNYLVNFQKKMSEKRKSECSLNERDISERKFESQAKDDLDISCPPSVHKISVTCSSLNAENQSFFQKSPASDQEHKMNHNDEKTQSVHYQNVEFNEVRNLGVGYYAFSIDEKTRQEQMDSLNNLRQQTKKKRTSCEETRQQKKMRLEARLAKICERRNIDKNFINECVSLEDKEGETNDASSSLDSEQKCIYMHGNDISNIPLPKEDSSAWVKYPKVRPWDIGKDIKMSFQRDQKDNNGRELHHSNDWVEKRRTERPNEFAPPSTYF